MDSKKLQKRLSVLFFIFGLALLYLLIRKVGAHDILKTIKDLGPNLIYIMLFPITWTVVQTQAWWRLLAIDGTKVSWWHVFLAKVSGEALNTVTPISFVGGDPYRIYLLQKKISKTSSAASVVIDRTMYMLAVALVLFVTLITAWIYVPLPGAWQILFPIFTSLFFVAFFLVVKFQKKGMFTFLSNFSQKIGFQEHRLKQLHDKIENLDREIGGFYQKDKLHFFEIMTLHFLGRFLGAVEIYLIVRLMNYSIPFEYSLFLASLTILINMVFVFIPGSMGVMEGGYGALFYLLKLEPSIGVVIQLVRRIRTFAWVGIGLLIILLYRPKHQSG